MTATVPTEATETSPSAVAPIQWFTSVRFACCLAVLLIVSFPGVLAGTHSFFFRDYGVIAYPTIYYARESFWNGELPLWNPYSHCGVPFLAQWGPMVLYPGSLIYLLLPLPWSLGLFCVLHLFLGGMGMYYLANRWTDNQLAAAVAGTAFVFNGIVFSSVTWPNYTVAIGWMPWVVLTAETAWRGRGRSVLLAAFAGAMQMLSGVPEVILLTWCFLGVLWIRETISNRSRTALVAFPLVIFLIAGLTAIQLLPFFELLAHSHRHKGFDTKSWAMAPWGWANLVAPLFRCAKSPQGIFYQPGHVFLVSYYMGITVLALALIGAWRVSHFRVWALFGAALFGLAMALGNSGFLYPFLKHYVPALGFARYPVKFIYITLFALPLLAAYGVAHLQSNPTIARRSLLIIQGLLVIVATALVIWGWQAGPTEHWRTMAVNTFMRIALLIAAGLFLLSRPTNGCCGGWFMPSVLIGCIWLDARTHTPHPHPTIEASLFAPGIVDLKPKPELGQSRALISAGAEDRMYRSRVAQFKEDFIGKRLGLWCNLHLLEAVPKIEGASTLLVKEQADIQNLFHRQSDNEHPRLADFLGVTHTNMADAIAEWVQRSTALPWITAGQRPTFAEDTNAIAHVTDPNWNPREVMYLPKSVQDQVTATNHARATILSQSFGRHAIQFTVEAAEPTLVTIAQTFYPAWKAQIDDRLVPLWRANYAFQALEVPAGKHVVRLQYDDRHFKFGAIISGGTLLASLLGWFLLRRTKLELPQ